MYIATLSLADQDLRVNEQQNDVAIIISISYGRIYKRDNIPSLEDIYICSNRAVKYTVLRIHMHAWRNFVVECRFLNAVSDTN